MGLTYHYSLRAPNERTAGELELFLKGVEQDAKRLGFFPTMVFKGKFDSEERRQFCRRLTSGETFESERLKGDVCLRPGQVWNHDATSGHSRLIPSEAVVLVITDEQGGEGVFGFFRYPKILLDTKGGEIPVNEIGSDWRFRNHTKSADPRIREIVAKFRNAGFLETEKDEFQKR